MLRSTLTEHSTGLMGPHAADRSDVYWKFYAGLNYSTLNTRLQVGYKRLIWSNPPCAFKRVEDV